MSYQCDLQASCIPSTVLSSALVIYHQQEMTAVQTPSRSICLSSNPIVNLNTPVRQPSLQHLRP
jgi:hypothetical protein